MKFPLAPILIAALVTAVSTAGIAASPALVTGMTVRDTAGETVGTVESVSGANAVIATGQHKVALPLQSFALDAKGPRIGLTRAELDAAAEKAAANSAAMLRAQLIPGVAVRGKSGATLGTIKQIDDDYVLLASTAGDVRLPVNAFGSTPDGVAIGMTAAEFQAAVAGTR